MKLISCPLPCYSLWAEVGPAGLRIGRLAHKPAVTLGKGNMYSFYLTFLDPGLAKILRMKTSIFGQKLSMILDV